MRKTVSSKINPVIPPEELKAYAKIHRLSDLDAYRDLYSQQLLDAVREGYTNDVLRELIHQVVGTGVKSVKAPMNIIAPPGKA